MNRELLVYPVQKIREFACWCRKAERNQIALTKTAISKATLMSFPLVGNLSEKTRRIADKPQ